MKDFSPLAITSAVVGFPARLCVITRADGTVYRIAESDIAITVSSDTFDVVPGIQISAIKHTANGEMPSCQIVAVHGSTAVINSTHLDIGLFDGAEVQMYIVDRLNLSRKGLIFTGAISTISYDVENRVVFDVKGPVSSAKIMMLQTRSPMCRTDLFSRVCGANPSSYVSTATVASIVDAFNFTISGLSISPPADGYFAQGEGITDGGVAFDLANWVQSSSTMTAYLTCNRILSVGTVLTLYPGCDKTLSGSNGCAKFSNALNFQGEPHFLGTAAAAQQV